MQLFLLQRELVKNIIIGFAIDLLKFKVILDLGFAPEFDNFSMPLTIVVIFIFSSGRTKDALKFKLYNIAHVNCFFLAHTNLIHLFSWTLQLLYSRMLL